MSTARGTANLTIAATQSTAPVYEFRCLYSHDLRKKKKLWHDGSLRYHTFNKRVMVYDESKNYIGDSHWREIDELQEGTELKLEKGVLVDVGERIGETQTDLAPLLEKRRLENRPSPHRPPLRPILLPATSRTALRNPQARSKSLSDVLGISQGPMGRARLPAQSPYGQLHNPLAQASDLAEPIAKKPRIGSNKENIELCKDRIGGREHLPEINAVALLGRPGQSGISVLQETRKAASPKQIIDISSEDEPTLLPSTPPSAASRLNSSVRKPSNSRGDYQQLLNTVTPSSRERKKMTSAARSKATRPDLTISKSAPVSSSTSSQNLLTRSFSSKGSLKTKLRLAVHKPRNKLIYKELSLPSNRSKPQLRTKAPPLTNPVKVCQVCESSPVRDCRRTLLSTLSELECDDENGNIFVGRVSSLKQSSNKNQDIDHGLVGLFTQSLSPSSIPKSPARVEAGVSEPRDSTYFLSRALGASSGLSPSPNRQTASHEDNGPAALGTVTPNVRDDSQLAPPSKLSALEQQLVIPPPKAASQTLESKHTSAQTRSIRRVVSENDSPRCVENQGSIASISQGSHTVKAVKNSNPTSQKPFKNPAKLTKSLSDTSAKSRVRHPPASRPAEEETTEDHGPWSRAEAYLLFDWFPPGRKKLGLNNGGQITMGLKPGKRGLLSDQVNAL